jgi:hypothetical protein
MYTTEGSKVGEKLKEVTKGNWEIFTCLRAVSTGQS